MKVKELGVGEGLGEIKNDFSRHYDAHSFVFQRFHWSGKTFMKDAVDIDLCPSLIVGSQCISQ